MPIRVRISSFKLTAITIDSKMNSPSVNDTFDYDFEAAGVASVVHTRSHHSDLTEPTHEIDDRNVPPVFGRLWREVLSVFTLACAPSLNVLTLFQLL